MAEEIESKINTGGPSQGARPAGFSSGPTRRSRLVADRWARWVVTAGGITIIISILAILLVIAAEVLPLFKSPTAAALPGQPTGFSALAAGLDEHRAFAYLVDTQGIHAAKIASDEISTLLKYPDLQGARIVAATPATDRGFTLGTSDGRILQGRVTFQTQFVSGERTSTPKASLDAPLVVHEDGEPVRLVAQAYTPDGKLVLTRKAAQRVGIVQITEKTTMMGTVKRSTALASLDLPFQGDITALAVDSIEEFAFAGSSMGELAVIDMRSPLQPKLLIGPERITVHNQAVTLLGFLLGDRTLVSGDQSGRVQSWQVLKKDNQTRLHLVHEFKQHPGAIRGFSASIRNKGFVTADDRGTVMLHYGTTGKTLLELDGAGPVATIALAPKSDAVMSIDIRGGLHKWLLDNPHPEVTWKSLFGKVWYEGYHEPEQVWQSTGGTDDFEAKFSLTPLIFGTLKGTFYALLFAIPLALCGALYASQFMHPSLKQQVKPTIEIMAALPSVVLGFIAGLWLAPMVEKIVPGIFLMPLVLTATILLSLAAWKCVPQRIRGRMKPGTEFFLLIPMLVVGLWTSFQLGAGLEAWALRGDYRSWLLQVMGLTYDQRNSLVVGFAMGFAVVPIIFTIAEDSLSSVPHHLKAASLALGATPWQTAVRVVLPTASPGIFSAVMIGFGRAVGETMIVLMATGNTPIMDWSIFNGFRALSANIAVELPEAPVHSTHFRVLFMAAMLLFIMTFVVNTVAEVVRLQLRKRYRVL